jgi:hypothetical protein
MEEYTGNEDHSISLSQASEWTKNYRNTASAVSTNPITAHLFGKDAILAILNQQGCKGIRIYYALDDAGKQQLIVVGADSSKNDLYEGLLAERSDPCPMCCSSANPLNTSV